MEQINYSDRKEENDFARKMEELWLSICSKIQQL